MLVHAPKEGTPLPWLDPDIVSLSPKELEVQAEAADVEIHAGAGIAE
jgi:hypothetical protein